jgi:cell division protein FtsI (penicillin-binding protein 3)/stage V sporulation protein D (sporulation-specific penicillin-binding protein)
VSTRERQANRRIRLLIAIFVLVFAGTFARAFWLQGVQAARLGQLAAKQHHELQTIPAGRGTIFDRSGVQLAIGEQTTTLFADTRLVADPRAIAVAAHKILGLDPNATYARLLDKRTGFYLDRFADPKLATRFLDKNFVGISGSPEEKRVYPQQTVAPQVIGFAGTDNKGLAGLEYQYDRQLGGRAGKETIIRDPFGRAIDVVKATPEREGSNVFTTIDHTIQANAEQVLKSTVAQWHAQSATAVVLDPSTGEVLAMAQTPGYNANNASNVPPASQRNRTVTDTYEPGSTFKLVTIGAALSEGIVTPTSRFVLPYRIQVADRSVHDAEPRPTETLTVAQILARSSNVGAITIAEKLGSGTLSQWITRFGFGKTTGIDFPGESPGQVLSLAQWSGSTIGNVPIGQGIAVTPIQLASAYAAIANGGVWIQPHLVTRIGGRILRHFTHRRIVSPAIDDQLKTMLTGVVDEHGATGNAAAIPGYTVAGKTGTGQIPGKNGYSASNGYMASFVGMVPVDKPRLLVLVTVEKPQGSIFGGVVAAPAFAQIAKFDLQYMAVAPNAPKTLLPHS